MDINYLQEFVVLADVRNYFNAADELFISQSSLSKHIKSLEKELGVELFERSTRHVRLTDAGHMFLPYARHISQIYRSAVSNLDDSRDAFQQRTLTIGSIPVMAPYGITEAIARFGEENPWIRTRVVEGDSEKLKQQLRQGTIELAFIRETSAVVDPALTRVPFASDSLVAVLPLDHHYARRTELTLAELDGSNFLLLKEGSFVYNLCVEACASAGFAPIVTYTGSRAENIIDLVSRGAGISLLMRKPAELLAQGKVALVSITPSVETMISLYAVRGAEFSREATAFAESLAAAQGGRLDLEAFGLRRPAGA